MFPKHSEMPKEKNVPRVDRLSWCEWVSDDVAFDFVSLKLRVSTFADDYCRSAMLGTETCSGTIRSPEVIAV
jgi:hypothetical protein